MAAKSLDTKILSVLCAYKKQHPGDPEMIFDELCQGLPGIPSVEIFDELHKLQGKQWIGCDLTEDGLAGLVWIEPKGAKVIQSIPQERVSVMPPDNAPSPPPPGKKSEPHAFVPGHAYDIFVSFLPDDDHDPQWVNTTLENIQRLLEIQFSHHHQSPRYVKHSAWTPEARQDLQESATVLILLSQNYLASEWGGGGADGFFRALEQRLQMGVKVFLMELDNAERPSPLGSCLGFQFWVEEFSGQGLHKLTMTLDSDEALPLFQEYHTRLRKLSDALATELRRQIKRAEIAVDMESKGILVDNDDIDRRLAQNVAKKLLEFGVGYIFPYAPIHNVPSEEKSKFEQQLLDCEGLLFIYGAAPAGWLISAVNRMRSIFAKYGKKPPAARAIYDGPPDTNQLPPPPFTFPGIIIHCRTCTQLEQGCQQCQSEKEFLSFIERLQAGKNHD